jgi:ribosomal protein S18 acetylase RimI-like enzyme
METQPQRPPDESLLIRDMPAADGDLRRVAAIIDEAFRQKYAALAIDRAAMVDILARSVRPEMARYAYLNGRPVGVAGMATHRRRFMHLDWRPLRRHYHVIRALIYYLILNREGPQRRDELKIQSLAVAPRRRGEGIGTALIEAVAAHARDQGYATLSLDVVDTNAGALRLYRRLGFEIVQTTRFYGLARRAGFDAVHHMAKRLTV